MFLGMPSICSYYPLLALTVIGLAGSHLDFEHTVAEAVLMVVGAQSVFVELSGKGKHLAGGTHRSR